MSLEGPRKTLLGSALLAACFAALWSSNVHQYLQWPSPPQAQLSEEAFVCQQHHYTTEIISIDPLLIYINNFTTPLESASIIAAGTPTLRTSELFINNQLTHSSDRTSRTSGLHPSLPAVSCLLTRARSFLGPLLSLIDDFGVPQLVQYEKGEKFDVHHDWFDVPQVLKAGGVNGGKEGMRFNRLASFFVFLGNEGVKGGETWFPFVEGGDGMGDGEGGEDGEEREIEKSRKHEEGGIVFTPIPGSALFWVNLHANGTGDGRVVHAGLRVEEGRKTAMNIWPRKFY